MSRSHYFYFPLSVAELEQVVEAHQIEFDAMIGDVFSEDEILALEKMLDSIAPVYVQPILSELSFDDFYPDPSSSDKQRRFFQACRSSLAIENLPYLESNPFQVNYLKQLLSHFSEVLIDQGGVQELQFKAAYLENLNRFRDIDSLISGGRPKAVEPLSGAPVDPIDFLVRDVYKEIERIRHSGNSGAMDRTLLDQSLKVQTVYQAMIKGPYDATALFQKAGLSPKDFDDHLEKLKFLLKKI